MSGYRGDGYGQHGDVGDEDFRFGDSRADGGRGAMFRGEGDDPRARQAAADWQRRFGREGHEGSYARHDDGYQAYRERHLAELDRDYDDWCREREQGFHRDFEQWRDQRRAVSNQPGSGDVVASDRLADRLVAEDGTGGGSRRRRS